MGHDHMVDTMSFVEDDLGFMMARCICGWSFGPVPGVEEVTDALMDHAFENGYLQAENDIRGTAKVVAVKDTHTAQEGT